MKIDGPKNEQESLIVLAAKARFEADTDDGETLRKSWALSRFSTPEQVAEAREKYCCAMLRQHRSDVEREAQYVR